MKPAIGRAFNFAYGSNMLRARIQARVPSARSICTAVAPGRELRWHKRGQDGSGKCDIVICDAPGALVHGVLYEFSRHEKYLLDKAEGLGIGYKEVDVQIEVDGQRVLVPAYQALQVQNSIAPFAWYKALVLAGARQHRLPPEYIAGLESISAVEDQDTRRHALNMAIVNAP